MSVLGHIAIGAVVARRITPADTTRERLPARIAGFSALALLPDVDFVLHALAPAGEMLDHRGLTHSLVFAVVVGLLIGFAAGARGGGHGWGWALVAFGLVASHGLLDAFGDTTLGVELLWPFSDARMLAPWHVLPNPALTGSGIVPFLRDLAWEAAVFTPAWLYAFWPRPPRQPPGPATLDAPPRGSVGG